MICFNIKLLSQLARQIDIQVDAQINKKKTDRQLDRQKNAIMYTVVLYLGLKVCTYYEYIQEDRQIDIQIEMKSNYIYGGFIFGFLSRYYEKIQEDIQIYICIQLDRYILLDRQLDNYVYRGFI